MYSRRNRQGYRYPGRKRGKYRPEFAQTVVKLGIDFQDMVTKNSLQAGLKLALEWHNYVLTSKPEV